MDGQGVTPGLKKAHIATSVSITIAGIIILILRLVAYFRVESWLEEEGVEDHTTVAPIFTGAWFILVGIFALIAACTNNRCLHITDIVFSTICVIVMGISLIAYFINLEKNLHSGDLDACNEFPACRDAVDMYIAALVFTIITYIIVIINLVVCCKSLSRIPKVSTFGYIVETPNIGVTVNSAPMAPATHWQTPPAAQMPTAAGYNPYAAPPAYAFQNPNGSYVTVADNKRLVQSDA